MAVQSSTFGGVGYERVSGPLDEISSSTTGDNSPVSQGVLEEFPPPSPHESPDSGEVKNLIQGAFDISSGGPSQGPAEPSAGPGQASTSSIGNALAAGNAIVAASASPPQDGAGEIPKANDTRPPGDTRSAEQIVADNPTLENLGNQDHVMDNLKKQCGDWTDSSLTPNQRADAAYRASEVLNYIKSSAASDGSGRSTNVTDDGKIDGFTKDGDPRHGTEAGALKDFGEQGYEALSPTHSLEQTSDTHVNKDGTTMSNAQWVGDNILKGLSAALNVGSQIAGVIGDLHIPIISQVADAASIGEEGLSQGAKVGSTALEHGDVRGAAEHAGVAVGETASSQLIGIPGFGKAVAKGGEDLTKEITKKAGKKGSNDTASTILDGPNSDGTPKDTYSKVVDTLSNL